MDFVKLSKIVAYILRHKPEDYGLFLDENGFVSINDLITAINIKNKFERDINKDDLIYIIDNSDKKRFEINADKIRALYGHSRYIEIKQESALPPDILYHGTSHKAYSEIKKYGLKPMSRQFIHLSEDIGTAVAIGKRRDDFPIILEINASKAYNSGIIFYKGNDKVWLCKKIPIEYIKGLNLFANERFRRV